ncbi:MAG: metallophosphoesterase [Verrucomicrobiota bacterium]
MQTPIEGKPSRFNRRNALRLITAGAAASLIDAGWIEPGLLSVTRRDRVCKQLPPALDGLRIGLLADFHFRPDEDAELLDKVVAQVRQEKLDLIALAGDFISGDPRVVTPLLARLEKMSATHGVFAVMGNHDGWAGDRAIIKRQFEKAGISFLINQHCLLAVRGESLAVAGTDFVWLGRPDPQQTLKGIAANTPILALVHEPDYFDNMTAHREIMLQLSGHSHGGQCRVPLIGYAPKTVKYGRKYVEGAFSNGNSNLFVTRGVGTTGPRVRFACPPELAVLTLRAAIPTG